MSDDLAWFPTPKEAFKQPGKPSHLSPAYDSVGSVPLPPAQERHRHSAGRKQIEQTRQFSDPSTSTNSQRTYYPYSDSVNTRQIPRSTSNPQYQAANASYAPSAQYAPSDPPSSAQYAANSHIHGSNTPFSPAKVPHVPPNAPYAAQNGSYQASHSSPASPGGPVYLEQKLTSQPQYPPPNPQPSSQPSSQRVSAHSRAERVPVGRASTGPSAAMNGPHDGHSARSVPLNGAVTADRTRPLLNPAAQSSSQSVASASLVPQEPQVAPLQTQGSGSADLRTLFDDVDRHKRGYLTERELSKALVNADYTLFDSHTVRLLMKMFDRDGDGAIYFAEFGQLWKYLHDWRQVFDRFDVSRNDSISFEEFSKALAAFGYTLSLPCVRFMFSSGSKLNRQGQRAMSFDMFVQSCISIKSITDTFKKYDTDRDGFVTIAFEDFLMETTKLH